MKKKYCFYIAYIFIVLGFAGCAALSVSPETLYMRAVSAKPYDAIIVPGVPYRSADPRWDDIMKRRVYWSKYLFQNGFGKNIVYSGSSVYTPYVEAKVMAMFGESLGIPKENIFVETTAEHSTENLYYSYHLCKKLGFKKIAFASDPVQSRFMRKFAKRIKIEMDFIPIIYDTLHILNFPEMVIDADKAKADNFISIIERESKWKRIKGTMGKNIKKVKK